MTTPNRPNVLWIYCDELRTDALECYGNRYATLRTPHIDSLAETGVLFEQAFVNSPVCVASRTSLLTGLYPEDTGVYNNEASKANYRLDQRYDTFPEAFARHGYTTISFGKEHVPNGIDAWMHHHPDGGDMQPFYEGVDRAALDIIHVPSFPYIVIGGRYPAGRPYPADPVTTHALRWFETAPQPFFARLSYLQPHTPVLPPPPFDTLYADVDFPDQLSSSSGLSRFEQRYREVLGSDQLTPEQIQRIQMAYYGLAAWVDAQIGIVLAALRQRGLLENTIIAFEADHGTSLGEGGRLQKLTFAPEVQRVPRIITWAGTLPAGQRRADLCEGVDLGSTLLDLAGLPVPSQMRGRRLFADPAPAFIHATVGYGYPSSRTFPSSARGMLDDAHAWPRRACVRTNRYRYEKNVRINDQTPALDQIDAFFADRLTDPDEMTNVIHDRRYADVVQTLDAALDARIAGSYTPPEVYTLGQIELR